MNMKLGSGDGEEVMKRLALFVVAAALLGLSAVANAQVAVSVRIGPRPRYVVPMRPVVYPVAPMVYPAPVVYRPYAAPILVARPVPHCGPVCRARIRDERREIRAERRWIRHERREHGWR